MKKFETWEEEFDKRWYPQVDETYGLQLKDFISEVVAQARKEGFNTGWKVGYNSRLTDQDLSKLSKQ